MGSRGSGSKGGPGGASAAQEAVAGAAATDPLGGQSEAELAEAAQQFVDTQEDDIFSKMSFAERNTMADYSGYNYTEYNQHARDLADGTIKPGQDKTLDRKVAMLSAALEKGVTDRQIMVYRGFIHAPLNAMFDSGNILGAKIQNHGFQSTSSKRSVALDFGDGGMVARIVLPKGYKGASPLKKNSNHPGESEVLIQKGKAFKVVATEMRGKTRYITLVPDDD